ncbi:alpha/beta fold hydrolase [Halopenitus persicus]|uniref:Pimeloyl-ACP methyl ester carboxylesterase n=1 Tax=Halopenitus persicus TaxID=1048396 RepID=A0A1H3DNW1_9EURY|nr:alpha/beta fold hydrolase [Halopenitus persicus]SDX67354.1 Pimeloyl-ACP methyl ester carboxylesterase [Halopenitus persicus]
MEHVTHHGRRIAYRVSKGDGDGPATLFVHGSGGTHAIWKAQARLRDTAPVVSVDLSGHGESDDVDAEPGPETLAAYADDVVAVAEETDATVLCGNSLGGAVAQWVALERDYADRLEGLVLQGTGAKLAVLQDLREWLADDFERAIEFLHGADRVFHDAPPEYVELSMDAMRRTGRAVVERDFLTCHRFDVRDRVSAIDVPTLAVAGEHDGLTPPRYHEFLASEIPDCERAVIEDAAHLAMIEQPEAFNALLREFLGRIASE